MSVTVVVAGVALFVTDGNELKEVLFPNAEHESPPHAKPLPGGKVGHLDGKEARTHAPVLIVDSTDWESLRYSRVTVQPLEAHVGRRWSSVDIKAKMASPGTAKGHPLVLNADARPTTRIALVAPDQQPPVFVGGPYPFRFPVNGAPDSPVHTTAAFTYPSGVRITVQREPTGPVELELASGGVLLYHRDVPPTPLGGNPSDGMVDHDFKWVYALLKPANGHLLDWARLRPVPLPAPAYHAADGAGVLRPSVPSVSTCFPGWI